MQLLKYCLVGGINTLVCAAVIFTLMHYGLSLYRANISGYIVGVLFSYVLNSVFTFAKKIELKTSLKFLICVVISWLANVVAITVALHFLPAHSYIVQCMGMVVYTIIGFVINKMWAMK
nr:GtrA family protein [Sodalis sp. dw_96]